MDWKEIGRWLTASAVRRGVPLEDAKQLAQQAICQFFDPEHVRYDPEVHGSVTHFLFAILNGLIANHRRRVASASSAGLRAALGDGPPTPEDEAILAERARIALKRIHDRAARDPVVQRIIALRFEGVDDAAELAEHLRIPITQVYEARRRIKAYAAATLILLGGN